MTHPTNREMIEAWSAAIDHVDDFGEEGDVPRQLLLNPAIFALLGEVRGLRILDAGCGQGYLARLLARRGAQVTGVEPADSWYRAVVAQERAAPLGITYLREDLATFAAATQGIDVFDAVVANMVFMDIPEAEPAIRQCVAALRPGGSLVFSLAHPCFEDTEESWARTGAISVRDYLRESRIPQTFAARFHRPLSYYLNLVIQAGCALRAIVEPGLGEEWAAHGAWYARNTRVPSFIVMHATRV
ncbi:MAG TPA: class I SAM-dependent methyltransferase [Ktedonobacterales bacterium]|nr:class I SAM-dependent methyltransferase [Ktedonobacterales bacterium]